ncbi:DUF3300 domain-containing protein, partial [Nostoc sp. NIES-2111]
MLAVVAGIAIGASGIGGRAQTPSATPAEAGATAPKAADTVFTKQELEKLLAPYALYPDALLGQLLPACAYPIDIVQASRWLEKNKAFVQSGNFSTLDQLSIDPTVKALARFPDIIAKLNADLDQTSDLGDAFVNQPDEVAEVIQDLRRRAQAAGSLATTSQQRVVTRKQDEKSYVVIEPTDPEVIYVPSYDPGVVYDTSATVVPGLLAFGAGVVAGAPIDTVWAWGRGWFYPPAWPGYPGFRPGGGNNINIDRGDINIGNGNVGIGNGDRPWRPDGDRYRPGQGTKPGLARPETRPSGPAGSRPGSGTKPGDQRPDVSGPSQRPGKPGTGIGDRGGASAKPSPKGPGKGTAGAAKPKSPKAAARPAPKKPSAANRPKPQPQVRNSA